MKGPWAMSDDEMFEMQQRITHAQKNSHRQKPKM